MHSWELKHTPCSCGWKLAAQQLHGVKGPDAPAHKAPTNVIVSDKHTSVDIYRWARNRRRRLRLDPPPKESPSEQCRGRKALRRISRLFVDGLVRIMQVWRHQRKLRQYTIAEACSRRVIMQLQATLSPATHLSFLHSKRQAAGQRRCDAGKGRSEGRSPGQVVPAVRQISTQ
jgi:hypothetical protein